MRCQTKQQSNLLGLKVTKFLLRWVAALQVGLCLRMLPYSVESDLSLKIPDYLASTSQTAAIESNNRVNGTTARAVIMTKTSNQRGRRHPDVVWLMSFPNSGTTYTLANVEATTKFTVASNYGVAVELRKESRRYMGGPFVKTSMEMPPTGSGLLTKTHCGHGALQRRPKNNIDGSTTSAGDLFQVDCTKGNMAGARSVQYGDEHENKESESPVVLRAIHLFRDPFDNVVARMNHFFKRKEARMNNQPLVNTAFVDSKQQQHQQGGSNSRHAFLSWCQKQDRHWLENEDKTTQTQSNNAPILPCRSEWHKYVIWHNKVLAFSQKESLKVLRIYYESYETKFNVTVKEILNFLSLPAVADPLPFALGRTYRDLYTAEEILLAKQFVQEYATEDCWNAIKHYFP